MCGCFWKARSDWTVSSVALGDRSITPYDGQREHDERRLTSWMVSCSVKKSCEDLVARSKEGDLRWTPTTGRLFSMEE